MHNILKEKSNDIKRLLKTELGGIKSLNSIELEENTYKALLYPTNDLFLYEHQFDAIRSLTKENEKLFLFQFDDLENVYDISAPFDYESYSQINLYSITVIFPESAEWLLVIDEELDFGIGIFVSLPSIKETFEIAYAEHYDDLLYFVKSELNNKRSIKSGHSHLNNIISIVNGLNKPINERKTENTVKDFLENLISGKANCKDINNLEITGCDIVIQRELLEKTISEIDNCPDKEEFWGLLVPHLSAESFSDSALRYFYKNKISAVDLCHKSLPDAWLKKYSIFDDEPLYVLADRYEENKYSLKDFVAFLKECAIKNAPVFAYILENYQYGEKWKTAVALGIESGDDTIKSVSRQNYECFSISTTHNKEEIGKALAEHQNEGVWLLAIAKNPMTPNEILHGLKSISNVKFARQIREAATEMLKIKNEIGK